jgi:hypothetical protein
MAGNLIRIAMWTPLLLGACSFSAATGDSIDARKVDAAAVDAPIDAPPGCNTLTCNGNTLTCETKQEVCAVSCSTTGGAHCTQFTPSNGADWTDLANVVDTGGDLTVTQEIVINTDTGSITRRGDNLIIRNTGEGVVNGYRFRLISAQVSLLAFDDLSIAMAAKVRVTGNHALIILARNTITIAGEIDADGGRAADPSQAGPGGGAGAVGATLATGCGFGPNGQFNDPNASGGAGGSFGRRGGDGGGNTATPGGIAAVACTESLKMKLQGGSGGGRGGELNEGGSGGGGGGAIQFTAGREISVAGLLHSGGAGGTSSPNKRGGGGAGAGGGFLFEAPTVNLLASATVVTNGGGGGDGKDGGNNNDPNKTIGETGQPNLTAAKGGPKADSNAGNGGNGGVTNTSAEPGSGNPNMGSGGGGGGIGKIEIQSVNPNPITAGAKLSPLTPTISILVGM